MLPVAKDEKDGSKEFDKNYFKERLKDIGDFLCYTKNVKSSVIPDGLKSEFNKIYEKFGCISSFWDKDNQSSCKIDDFLWGDNFLLKYLFEDSISYKGTDKTRLHCEVCNVYFKPHPLYLKCHLIDQSHICKHNNYINTMKDDLWKNFLSYKHAYENFVVIKKKYETIHCKICGINLPFSNDYLIKHLDNVQHIENFNDIFNFKSNNFKRKQLMNDSSISGNGNNKRKLEVEQSSDTPRKYKRSKETVGVLSDQGASNSECSRANVDKSDSKVLLSPCCNFNDECDEIFEGDQRTLKHKAVTNKKGIIIPEVFQKVSAKHEEFMKNCRKNVESNKYFCEVCNCFDINLSSDDVLLQHEHLTGDYPKELNSYQWRHCKFCSAMLFCSYKLLSSHYRNSVHQELVNLFILRESSDSNALGVKPLIRNSIFNLSNMLIKRNTVPCSKKKKGYVCYPCNYVALKSSKFEKHLNVNHSKQASCSSNYKIFECDCLGQIYCDHDYYIEHKFSVPHVNVIDFLAVVNGGQQSITSFSNTLHKRHVYNTDSDMKVFKTRKFEESVCNEHERNFCDQGNSTSCDVQDRNISRSHPESSDCASISTVNRENRCGNKIEYKIVSADKLSLYNIKSIKIKNKERRRADIESHHVFMTKFREKIDILKFFCQLCRYFEINSSENAISVHENSAKHILNLNSGILENCEWQYCQFCSARLFCTHEIHCYHYRHQTHLEFVNISTLTSQNLNPTNEINGSKSIIQLFSKNNKSITKYLPNTILRRAQKYLFDQVFGFYCHPCNYMTVTDLKWAHHLNTGNHDKKSKFGLNNLFHCDCHIYLYCDSDFYYEHTLSGEHMNLVSFFSQGICVQQSKKFSEPLVNNNVLNIYDVNNEPSVCNLIENNSCNVTHVLNESREHVAMNSFISEGLCVQDTKKSIPNFLESEINCYVDNNNGSKLLRRRVENNFHTDLGNDSCSLDTTTKGDNGKLNQSGDKNKIKVEKEDDPALNFHENCKEESVEKDGSNIDLLDDENFKKEKSMENFSSVSNLEGVDVSNVKIEENSIKFIGDSNNDKKLKRLKVCDIKSSYLAHLNEFMEKTVRKKVHGFIYFCQFCGILKTNSSQTHITSEHEHSETHLNNVEEFLKFHHQKLVKNCSWRQCEFCSILLFCTCDIFNDHYQHPVHLQMIENSITKKKKRGAFCNEDVECRGDSKNNQLNSLLSAVMRNSSSESEYVITGHYCSICDYCTCEKLEWDAHMVSNEHQQNCYVPTFRYWNFKTINCGCRISFFCNDDFYSDHKSSVMHTNLAAFFKELSCSQAIK